MIPVPMKRKSVKLGKNVVMGEHVILHARVVVGDNCRLGSNIVIYEDTIIGNSCTIEDGAILGKQQHKSASMTRPTRIKVPPLTIGNHTIIGTHAVLYRGTRIGNDSVIGDGVNVREECRIGNKTLVGRGVTINYHTRIGNNCKVMDLTHLTGNMVVEDDVFISVHVSSTNDNLMGRGPAIYYKGPVIKRGALIGGGAILLPGVTVHPYAIVGAGAVVTKDIPARKLALGIPARVVSDIPKRFLPTKKKL
jgi:acetyltransferase-like isoleucine patch superfamily enzyme